MGLNEKDVKDMIKAVEESIKNEAFDRRMEDTIRRANKPKTEDTTKIFGREKELSKEDKKEGTIILIYFGVVIAGLVALFS